MSNFLTIRRGIKSFDQQTTGSPKTCPLGHPPKTMYQFLHLLREIQCVLQSIAWSFSAIDSVIACAMVAIYLMEKLIDKPTFMTKVFAKNKPYH